MSDLSSVERLKIETLFGMESGYVLDFSNNTFSMFTIENVGIDIFDRKYEYGSNSKANRLRKFWLEESNEVVGKLLSALLDYWLAKKQINGEELSSKEKILYDECQKIVSGLNQASPTQIQDYPFSLFQRGSAFINEPNMTTTKRPLKVFLCHSSQDKPIVRELHDRLLSEGWIDPWLDKEKLRLGEDFDLEIEKAIESTDAVIAFISENAVKKTGYIQKELRLVYDAQMYRPDGELFTIPLRLEECEPPHRFKYWHWGDYFGEEKEKTYQSLLNSLKFIHERVLKSEAAEKTRLEAEELKRQKKAAKEKTEREAKERAERERIEKELREKQIREAKEKRETHKKEEKPAIVKPKAGGQTVYWFGGFVVIVLGIIFLSSLNNPPSTSQPTPEDTLTQEITPLVQITVEPSATKAPESTSTLSATQMPTSLPTEITDAKGITMRLVPAGEFTMGSEISQEVVRQVDLGDFYMDIYEVTNAAYKLCVDARECPKPLITNSHNRTSYYGNSRYDNYPVIFVDWMQAKNYCEWRGANLPTEAQWEKAARGTDGRTYPWGGNLDCRYANYSGCGSTDTMAVGSFDDGKSPFGIYDMAGNVFEIVDDWYSGAGNYRIVRGGSWDSGNGSWNVENVNYVISTDTLKTFSRDIFRTNDMGGSYNIGFRCAKDATP